MQDRDALERLKARRPVSCRDIAGIWVPFYSRRQRYRCGQDPRHDALFLIKSTYSNGTVMINAQEQKVVSSNWMVLGPFSGPIGFAEPKTTEYLDDDGSEEWARLAAEIRQRGGARDGMLLMKSSL